MQKPETPNAQVSPQVQIYALCEPGTEIIRYIGKAKDAQKRLKAHLNEALHQDRPVHRWLRKIGQTPTLIVLEVILEAQWTYAERAWIAKHQGPKLLNVAPGGDQPSQTLEQRRNAAKAASRSAASKDPRIKRFYDSVRDALRMRTEFIKKGRMFDAYLLGFNVACHQANVRALLLGK